MLQKPEYIYFEVLKITNMVVTQNFDVMLGNFEVLEMSSNRTRITEILHRN